MSRVQRVRRAVRGWLPLAALIGSMAGGVQAAAPPAAQWLAEGCSACHLNPTQYSPNAATNPFAPIDGRGGTTLASRLASGMASVSDFWTKLNGAGSPMTTFATATASYSTDTTQFNRLNNVYQYLLAIRDGFVESNSALSGTATTVAGTLQVVNLGTLTFGQVPGARTATVTIVNPRSRAISHSLLALAGSTAEFAAASSCADRVVAANFGSCTITITFSPTSSGGAKSASLALSFGSDGIEATPASRSLRFDGTTNLAPLAHAGGNQSVAKNATVTLVGSGSTDGNADTLNYAWTLTPPGGVAAPLPGSGANRSFTASLVGTYTASLVVNDGFVDSVTNSATILVTNTAPNIAASYSTASATAPTLVSLSSAGSSDPNGDGLFYSWTIVDKPAGSGAAFSGSAGITANPTFTADKSGPYRVTLVVSDGTASSAPATLNITLGNTPPVANAGSAQSVTAPTTVNLSGSATDANNDTLSYAWSFSVKPILSAATLTNTNAANASFTADKAGRYDLALSVSDGKGGSDTKSVTITAGNTAPVANAGGDRTVSVRTLVTLSGSGADANGDALSYRWDLSGPTGSTATLSNATTALPGFTPDVAGNYGAQLTVSDGQGGSNTSTATITALLAPVANAGAAQVVATGSTVTLDGSASTTSTSGPLSYAWTLSTRPVGSNATISGATTVRPTFLADVSGTYVASLQVTDSLGTSPASTVTITGDRAPVANAGAAQAVTIGTAVTLDGTGSTDADNDPLTYQWTLGTRPVGSASALSRSTAARPTFTPDVAGSYVASLVVSDGKFSSAAASITVMAGNPPPLFTLSTASLNPSTQLTLRSTVSAIIGNGGGLPLTLGTLTFGGAAAGDYALASSNGCTPALVIAPAGSCTLVVSFAPTAAGSRVASLSITHDAAGSPAAVALSGTATPAPQGRIALNALSLTYPPTQVGTALAQTLTVQNTGDAALTFSALSFGGSAAADYTRGGSCGTATPLAAAGQCTLVVTFQPATTGSRSATLTVASDASNGSATISLAGTGVPVPAPAASLSTALLDFGTQTVGGLYPARNVTLSNSGTADLTGITLDVLGSDFASTGSTCTVTLAAGASCTVSLRFTAAGAGVDSSGSLRVTSNANGSPHIVALAGKGTAVVVPVLAWSSAAARLDFGNVTADSVSATQSLTLLNQGPGGVTLALLNAVGADSAAFSVTAGSCTLGQPLFEGQSCSIDVRFAPASAGPKAATVQVASSGSAPAELALAGSGLGGPSPALGLSATALAFGSVRVGAQSAPTVITLTGAGSGVVRVLGLAVTGAYTVQTKSCPAVPFALAVGAECTITVTLHPQVEGGAAGKLTITSDAAQPTQDVALSGAGEPAADLSGGGCSLVRGDSATDPTLWTLLLLAVAALCYRARARRRDRR